MLALSHFPNNFTSRTFLSTVQQRKSAAPSSVQHAFITELGDASAGKPAFRMHDNVTVLTESQRQVL